MQLYHCLGILWVNSPSKCLQGYLRPPPPNWNQSSSFNEPCVHLFAYNPLNLCSVTAAWIQPAGEAKALAKTQTREVWVKNKLQPHSMIICVKVSILLAVCVGVCICACMCICMFKRMCYIFYVCAYLCGAAVGCWAVSVLCIHMTVCSCSSRST